MIEKILKKKMSLQKINSNNPITKKAISVIDRDVSEVIIKELKDNEPEDKKKTTISKDDFLNKFT